MSFNRATVAPALANVLDEARAEGDTFSVFSAPPESLNAPALVVGRPIEVRYGVFAMNVDEAELPVICIGQFLSGEDVVSGLIAFVRRTVQANNTLGGAVPSCVATLERSWRAIRVGGTDLLAADVVLTING